MYRPYRELLKKLLDVDVMPAQATGYIAEVCRIPVPRARRLIQGRQPWTFREAAAVAADLDIPRQSWADVFWPGEVADIYS